MSNFNTFDTRQKPASQQKLAEKLIILNERAEGLLTRLHYSKQSCEESRTCPPCLTEKQFDNVIKNINRKFPKIDSARSALQGMNLTNSVKSDIRQNLQVHYHTFIDILELKEYVMELLTNISVSAMSFDIRINFSLTANFLDLLCKYIKIILLLGRHENVKAIIGMYNIIYDANSGDEDPSVLFHRMGTMLEAYGDQPLKKLVEDILPLSLRVGLALKSLHSLHVEKHLTVDQMRNQPIYNLTTQTGLSSDPVISLDPGCRLINLDKLNEWILFGYLVCPSQLNSGDLKAWKNALCDSYIITIYRDEVVNIHSLFIEVFEKFKGHRKLISMVNEAANIFQKDTPQIHAARRNHLRYVMQEMINIVSSSPGLIAPKMIVILDAMSTSAGEILWLVRNWATDWKKHRVKVTQEMFSDSNMSVFLYCLDTLSRLITEYHPIVKRYFLQYLKQSDCVELRNLIQNFPAPEEESLLLTSFIDKLGGINVDNIDKEEDFKPLRVDWQRFQAYTSVNSSELLLKNQENLANIMNIIEFHSRCVDNIDVLLREVTNLSNLCFYQKFIQDSFQRSLERCDTAVYSVVYACVCSHFINTCNDYCPEEHCFIGKKSIDLANHFLDVTAKEAQKYLSLYCNERLALHNKIYPAYGAELMYAAKVAKDREAKKERQLPPIPYPGDESKRTKLEESTMMDKHFARMVSHLQALNTYPSLIVWQHTFVPREYIIHHLDELFNKLIAEHIYKEGNQIRLPSVMSHYIDGLVNIFRQIECYITLDTSRIFNVVLLQHTQPEENCPGPSLASRYTAWYIDKLLEHLTAGDICYAPLRLCFVTKHQMAPNFNAELYTNIGELQALAKLLGPYGIKFMGDQLMARCENIIHTMLSIVTENKDILGQIRTGSHEYPTASVGKFLKDHERFSGMCIVVGALFNFRRLTVSALKAVVGKRAPYIQNCVLDFKKNLRADADSSIVDEMATAAGYNVDADPALCAAILKHCNSQNCEYLWTLFNTMIASVLPLQSFNPNSVFKTPIEGHENNLHCIATTVTMLSHAAFTNIVRAGVEQKDLKVLMKERMREFIESVAERMLKLQLEDDRELQKEIKHKDSLFIIIDRLVKESPYITYDMLEESFPFTILRNSFRVVYENKKKKQKNPENEI